MAVEDRGLFDGVATQDDIRQEHGGTWDGSRNGRAESWG